MKPMISREEIALLNDAIHHNDIYFITARVRTKGFSAEHQTRLWLSSIGVAVDNASVIATQFGKKGKLADAMDLDVFLEDNPDNALDIIDHGVDCWIRRWQYNDGIIAFNGKYVDSLKDFLLHPEIGDL